MLDLRWQSRAACAGMDTSKFYLKADTHPEVIQELKILCLAHCAALAECRAHALTYEDKGFWAGMTESERRRIRTNQRIEKRTIRFAYLTPKENNNANSSEAVDV